MKNKDNEQKQFEQYIELLITYKKCNLEKEVYINTQSLNEALKWYQTFTKNIDPELVKQIKENINNELINNNIE